MDLPAYGFTTESTEGNGENTENGRYRRFPDRLRFFSVLCALFVLLCALCGEKAVGSSGVYAVVLGIAQDGGVPHIGCRQEACEAARRDPARRQRVASL